MKNAADTLTVEDQTESYGLAETNKDFHFLESGSRILRWTQDNSFSLLENGEEFFPRLFDCIDSAEREVLIETFIWFEDGTGNQLADHLVRAAKRGARVTISADGYGSCGFSNTFKQKLCDAGVEVRLFDPQPSFLSIRTNMFCRLHRKLAVIDGTTAFVGGINFSDEHLRDFGPESKQDYAVEVRGQIVKEIRNNMLRGLDDKRTPWWKRSRYWLKRFHRPDEEVGSDAQALFATRDNADHSTDIESLMRIAIRRAKHEIVIANAYFFPGYRFIRDLIKARKRGVRVQLIMQGRPDMQWVAWAASLVYDELHSRGVEIYLYNERPLHAKVATIDDYWATVGSSNLDPTSLGLNYEANLFMLDHDFNRTLRSSLQELIDASCSRYDSRWPGVSRIRRLAAAATFHLTRRMPSWGKRVLRRRQEMARLGQ